MTPPTGLRTAALIPLSLAMALALAWPASAGLRLEASVGFDGFYVPGEWTPVEVILSNQPEETDRRDPVDLDGVLTVLSRARGASALSGRPFAYTREVHLPANSTKSVWMLIKAATEEGGVPPDIQVDFRATNRRAHVHETVRGRVAPRGSSLVLVVREPGVGQTMGLPGLMQAQSFQVAAVRDLPDHWAAYSAVSAVFLTGRSALRLTSVQVHALRQWIEQGGVLIVDGDTPGDLMGSPVADLLPVETSERSTWRLRRGDRLAPIPTGTSSVPSGSVVLLGAAGREGARVLWEVGDQVLAASRPVGLGRVGFLAWGLSDETMRSSARAAAATAGLLPSASARMVRERFNQMIRQNTDPAPDFDPPSVFLSLLLLGAYFLVVGPMNYVWLSRRHMIEWAWVTIPILIAGFCVLFYAIGYVTRSNSDTLRHINVVTARSGVSQARCDAISLYVSASKQTLDFTSDQPEAALTQIATWDNPWGLFSFGQFGSGAWRGNRGNPRPGFGMRGVSDPSLQDSSDPASVALVGNSMSLPDQLLRQWSVVRLESQGPVDLGGTIDLTCEFLGAQPDAALFRLRGEVVNNTPFALTNCAILWGGRCFILRGDSDQQLDPGERWPFQAAWNASPGVSTFGDRGAYDTAIDRNDPTHIRLASLRAAMLDDVELPWLNPRLGQPHFVAHTDVTLLAPEPDRQVVRAGDHTLVVVEMPVEVATPVRFSLTGAHLPRSHTILAPSEDSVRIDDRYDFSNSPRPPALFMHDADVLITHRLPWDSDVRTEVEHVSVALQFTDSPSHVVRLFALDRSGLGDEPWIEVPLHGDPAVGNTAANTPGPHSLPAARVVDPSTGEITLMIQAQRRTALTMGTLTESVLIDGLELIVRGRAAPPPAPNEETAS